MRVYTFEIEVYEGTDEFWEEITRSSSGCDAVQVMLTNAMASNGLLTEPGEYIDYRIKLKKYEDKT